MKTFSRIAGSFVFALAVLFGIPSESFAANAKEFYAGARKHKDIHAFAATCHSAHETGNWTSELWKKARNGAGLKADNNWIKAGRPVYRKNSKEVVRGKTVNRVSNFRSYKSLKDFLADYRTKIVKDYPLASKHSDTMWGYFSSLQKGRYGSWATTDKYFEHMTDKAINLAPKLLGSKWKSRLAAEYVVARSRNLLSKKEIAVIEKKFKTAGIAFRK